MERCGSVGACRVVLGMTLNPCHLSVTCIHPAWVTVAFLQLDCCFGDHSHLDFMPALGKLYWKRSWSLAEPLSALVQGDSSILPAFLVSRSSKFGDYGKAVWLLLCSWAGLSTEVGTAGCAARRHQWHRVSDAPCCPGVVQVQAGREGAVEKGWCSVVKG